VPGDPLFDYEYKPYTYDPERAKRLLTEAGYPNGFETTLQTSTAGSGQIMPVAIAEWIQRDLEKVGIKLKLETYEWITYLGIFINGMKPDIGMNQISWGFTAPVLLSFMAQTKYHPPGTNTGFYSNKLVDEYIAKAEHARTIEEYHKYYKMAHEQIMEDAGYCAVVHDLNPYLMNKRVQGFVHASENWFDCVPIWLED
jgi:peptide/nickel transport system substrate-binding protein